MLKIMVKTRRSSSVKFVTKERERRIVPSTRSMKDAFVSMEVFFLPAESRLAGHVTGGLLRIDLLPSDLVSSKLRRLCVSEFLMDQYWICPFQV